MSFKYKVAFIGFIGEGYGDFLNSLALQLRKAEFDFEALVFGQHVKALIENDNYVFKYFDVKYLPKPNELIASPEMIDIVLNADFYIIWNGYHNMYAQFRHYCDKEKIPYLLSEYTSIDKLFFFDTGLHGERSEIDICKKAWKQFDSYVLEKYVRTRYGETDRENDQSFIRQLQEQKKSKKLLLYLGIWDEAAGLNPYTTEEVKKTLFPFYRSTGEVLETLVNHIDETMLLLIKLHPNDTTTDIKKIEEITNKHPNVIFIDADKQIDLQILISICDLVVTMTSTLSILTAFYRVPLLLLGKTYLSNSGYAYQLEDKKELKELLIKALNKEEWTQREKACELFFGDFIRRHETYSIDKGLNKLDVKTIDHLIQKIVNYLHLLQKYSRQISSMEIFSLIVKDEYRYQNFVEKNNLYKIAEERLSEVERLVKLKDELYETAEDRLSEINRLVKLKDELYETAEDRLSEINRLVKLKDELYETAEDRGNQLNSVLNSKTYKFLKKMGIVNI